jgi:Tfp pilus assembly protein PilO
MNSLITPIVLIVLSVGLFFTFTDTQYAKVKELKASNAEYDRAIASANELIAARDKVLAEYNAIPKQNLEKVQKLVPNNVDSVRLIIDVNGITSKYGVSVKNVKIDTLKKNNKDQVVAIDDGKPYNSATLSFSVTTKYETFIQIMKDIESSLRILDMESVKFQAVDTANPQAPADTYTFDVTLRTYWMK